METTTVEYFEGGLRMEAYVAWKACTPGTKLPAVVVCHTAQGPQVLHQNAFRPFPRPEAVRYLLLDDMPCVMHPIAHA